MGATKTRRTAGGLEVALENLTNELKGHRDETREDFKELRCDVKDIKSDVATLKLDLAVVKAQRSTEKDKNQWGWERFGIIASCIGTVILAAIEFFRHTV
jgi:hypothetical protein